MKQFFGSFLGAFLGIFIAFIFGLIVFAAVVSSFADSLVADKKTTKVKPKSILHLTFNQPIVERASKNPFEDFDLNSMSPKKSIGLDDILSTIKKAKSDSLIKGIYLDFSSLSTGIATLEEVRNSLLDFKTSGKFIFSYSEGYTQGSYYLASVSDKIYLNPQGELDFRGLSAQIMFYKGLLEKLEIDAQIFRHGKFKSAIEPFDLDKMSEANREQTMAYVGSIWNHLLKGISESRKISVDGLNKIADSILIRNAEDAVKYNFADELKYKDEMLDLLKEKVGTKKKDKLNLVALEDYTHAKKRWMKSDPDSHRDENSENKIAVIYAVGAIEGGEGGNKTIGSERISKAIRDARLDDKIKAIVLRINSPGGSALASDVIWREMVLAKKGKPVVVSMGDVAASGGYYISCAADVIVAQPNTITGSIGVFGILPNAQKFFNNKLGITIDTANTNKHSDFGTVYRPVKPEEEVVIQQSVEHVYNIFLRRVAEGRKMNAADVDSIGQGRVWSGVDAKRIGLVDQLGGINDAIKLAAEKAKLKKYKTVSLPKMMDPLEELFQLSEGVRAGMMKEEMGEYYNHYKKLKQILSQKGVQARMEYDVVLY